MSKEQYWKGKPAKGDVAPDFTLPNVYGESISLGNILQDGRRALVVFLRHLG